MKTAEYDNPVTACGLCGSHDVAPHYRDFRYNEIWRCKSCDILFMNPQYSAAHLAAFYGEYYGAEDGSSRAAGMRIEQDLYMSLIERYCAVGRLLDIGCGRGYTLEAARARGWEVAGFDVDCEVTTEVARRLGVRVDCGEFLDLDWPGRSFDVIWMHQVLEHLKTPLSYLVRVRELLADGGLLFVSVPNIRSASATLKKGMEHIGLRRTRIGSYYDTDHHLWYYTPKVLQRLLENQGFQPLHVAGCHKYRTRQPRWARYLRRAVWERLKLNSTFLVIARKERR